MELPFNAHAAAAARIGQAPRRVLVLEDEREFAGLLSDFLAASGYSATTVENGTDGLKALLESDFDAILCDMMMPMMTGDLFYLATERTRPHLCARFIFMTGHVSNPKIDFFIKSIGGLLLTKPFTMLSLLESIEHIMHVTGLRRALKTEVRSAGFSPLPERQGCG